MLTYLLEKLDKIKKDHALYCSTKQIEKEDTKIGKKENQGFTVYDFICRKN